MSSSPDEKDIPIEDIAKALRSAKNQTPEYRALIENAIARMERTPAYYEALGGFVTEFARVETTLQQTLWLAAGVPATVARAIFSGLKVEGCLQFIKRVADAKNWSATQQAQLKEITDRLGPINKLRNDILHHGVSPDLSAPDSWLFSNREFAHIPEKIREFAITPALLNGASADLSKLFHLSMLLGLYATDQKLGQSTERQLDRFLRPAWQYKPPQPAKTAGRSPKAHPKRPRQRRASPLKP
jgi:hypothetical protein